MRSLFEPVEEGFHRSALELHRVDRRYRHLDPLGKRLRWKSSTSTGKRHQHILSIDMQITGKPAEPTFRGSDCCAMDERQLWRAAARHGCVPRRAGLGRSRRFLVWSINGCPGRNSIAHECRCERQLREKGTGRPKRFFRPAIRVEATEKVRFMFLLTGRHRYRSVQVAHQKMKLIHGDTS